MIRIRQKFNQTRIQDVYGAVLEQFKRPEIRHLVHAKDRVAVGCGSRGIHGMDVIAKGVIDSLLELGARPFIVPAMGSHGGATPAGQRQILSSYGITEETMGVPIVDTMETVSLGETKSGIPIFFSKPAYEADWVLPINRIKLHTDFSGPIESGLIKMMSIGFGKEKGCTSLHRHGTADFARIIPEAGRKILSCVHMRFGIGIVENACDHTAVIEAIQGEALFDREPQLLELSKKLFPGIPFQTVDVLIVEKFGKDISGAGMDPNITGRSSVGPVKYFTGPRIQRIVVCDLTDASHGNGVAVNVADFITRKFFDKLDLKAVYANGLACCNPQACQIPVIMETEEEAVAMAVKTCRFIDPEHPRIVRLRSTLHLDEFEISEALREEALANPNIEIL